MAVETKTPLFIGRNDTRSGPMFTDIRKGNTGYQSRQTANESVAKVSSGDLFSFFFLFAVLSRAIG